MRYYNLLIKTEIEIFSEAVNETCKRYGYDNYQNRINGYIFQTFANDINTIFYREDKNIIYAIFSYNEKKYSFDKAYDYIIDRINDVSKTAKLYCKTKEITMYEYYTNLHEAYRRNYIYGSFFEIKKAANVEMFGFDEFGSYNKGASLFDFDEIIIDTQKKIEYSMFGETFIKELSNIEKHKNNNESVGNMVHYVISARSVETAKDMSKTLVQKLIEAKRLSSHRMEIISEIRPDAYKYSYLEDIIENNNGGVIVIVLLPT